MDFPPFRYMAWAKEYQSRGSHPLHLSGLPAATLQDLGVDGSALRIHAAGGTTEIVALREAVARRYGVPTACVQPTCGTHHANFLVLRALVRPGDAVLVESPWYEALPGTVRLLGGSVVPFHRRREEGWRLPVAEIRAGLEAGARLVVLTDLHNPTGTAVRPDAWAALEGAAREFGARVLVDEVYRDFLPPPYGTAFREDGPFVVTSSLTKVYGMGALRIGWILAPPEIATTAREVNEYVVVNLPVVTTRVALEAWDRLPARAEAARERAHRNGRILAAWIRRRGDLRWSPPDGGISALLEIPALAGRDDVAWCRRVLDDCGVGLVPGSMFEAKDSVRISFGCPPELLEEGLALLDPQLDRL